MLVPCIELSALLGLETCFIVARGLLQPDGVLVSAPHTNGKRARDAPQKIGTGGTRDLWEDRPCAGVRALLSLEPCSTVARVGLLLLHRAARWCQQRHTPMGSARETHHSRKGRRHNT